MLVTLDDILQEYKQKFGYIPVLGRGSADEHMELLINAIDSETPIENDYREADPSDVFL